MMEALRIIKTTADYDKAMSRLRVLMNKGENVNEEEGDELELLALLIHKYEECQGALACSDPVEAIKFCMEQQGLARKDLIPYFGSLSKVSEVLSYKRSLSIGMIRRLSKGLGISADILIGRTKQDKLHKDSSECEAMLNKLRTNQAFAVSYLENAVEQLDDPNHKASALKALRTLVEVYGGLEAVAEEAGISAESLCRALSPKGNPTLTVLQAVFHVMGARLSMSMVR